MWSAMLTQIVTFSLTANPLPAALPPKIFPPFQVDQVEDFTLTIKISAESSPKWVPVQTPKGPRVRLTSGDLTFEASRFRIKYNGMIRTITAAKDGTFQMLTELDPDAPSGK